MLRLKGIEKFYKTGDGGVLALKGIDINVRKDHAFEYHRRVGSLYGGGDEH